MAHTGMVRPDGTKVLECHPDANDPGLIAYNHLKAQIEFSENQAKERLTKEGNNGFKRFR